MEKLLNNLVHLGKFVGAVVVPVTIWFLVLRQDVSATAAALEQVRVRQNTFEAERDRDKEKLNEQYSTIVRELGEIRGELKRIGK